MDRSTNVQDARLVTWRDESMRKSLSVQREKFKTAKLAGDFDIMRDILENLKMDLKLIALQNGMEKEINYVEKVLRWYDMLPQKYTKNSPEGKIVKFPADINIKINYFFVKSYEILVGVIRVADLL